MFISKETLTARKFFRYFLLSFGCLIYAATLFLIGRILISDSVSIYKAPFYAFLIVGGCGFLVGLLPILLSNRIAKLLKIIQKYEAALSRYPDGYIPDIATFLGQPELAVKREICWLSKKKKLFTPSIDTTSNRLV